MRARRLLSLAMLLAITAACGGGDSPAGPLRVTLESPLAGYTVLQGFVWNAQRQGYHLANDLVAEAGAQVRAAADGRVFFAEAGVSGYGGIVLVEHRPAGGDAFVTLYGHLSARRGLLVTAGDSVARGAIIGTIADDDEDGGPWGPHLHFGLRPGAGDLDAETCGVWLYVGYSRSCSGWSHERFRDQWIDPRRAVAEP